MGRFTMKDVDGKVIFRNSISTHGFSLLCEFDPPETKLLKIYSDAPDIPDVFLDIDDVISVIFNAYRKAAEHDEH